MTFEQWFEANYWPVDDADEEFTVRVARAAWEAGYADGVEAMGGPVDPQ